LNVPINKLGEEKEVVEKKVAKRKKKLFWFFEKNKEKIKGKEEKGLVGKARKRGEKKGSVKKKK